VKNIIPDENCDSAKVFNKENLKDLSRCKVIVTMISKRAIMFGIRLR